jgi:FkbM family methyltransferase
MTKSQLQVAKELLYDGRRRLQHFVRLIQGRDPRVQPTLRCNTLHLGTRENGWCICPDDLTQSSVVYSAGVGMDVSFDLALMARIGCQVSAFDPTPISIEWVSNQQLPESFHFYPYGVAAYDGIAKFELPAKNSVSFTMMSNVGSNSKSTVEAPVYRLNTILKKLGHQRVHLLKLDIEGGEYTVIPDLIKEALPVDQLLVEFHHRMLKEPNSAELTVECVQTLNDAGFELFHVSPAGLEYSFVRTKHR